MTIRRQRGFTLLEVMIALGILFASLTVLIWKTAKNVRTTERAAMLGVATDLTRGKMYDLEEDLLKDGFQELDEEKEGDFDDEGYGEFTWEATIEKIELPQLGALTALSGEPGEDGQPVEPADAADNPLAGLMAMGGGDASAAAGAGFIQSQFELISQVLEASIRKITLTVKWEASGFDEELKTILYVTDPAAMNKVIQTGGAPSASDDGTDSGSGSSRGGGSGSGSGSGSSSRNGGRSSGGSSRVR